MAGTKKSVARFNCELWGLFLSDMEKLYEEARNQNYGIAREHLADLADWVRHTSEILGGRGALVAEPGLPAGDERRQAWDRAAQSLDGLRELLERREYAPAEAGLKQLLADAGEHARAAIAAYREERQG